MLRFKILWNYAEYNGFTQEIILLLKSPDNTLNSVVKKMCFMCFQLFSHLLLVFLDISNSQYNMVRFCFWKHRAFVSCSSYNIFCSSDYTVFDYHLGNVMVTFNKQHGCIISIVNYGDYIWGNWKHESCCRR